MGSGLDAMNQDSHIGKPPAAARHKTATLGGFMEAATLADGVRLRDLAPLDALEVRTRNSVYRFTVLNPLENTVLVSGGAFFPVPVRAALGGASIGGSMLKLGVILVGFQCEIAGSDGRVITTRVREIRVNPPTATAGPS